MTNLRKHLQGHSGEYKKLLETEATKQEDIEANSQASVQAKLKQVSLQDLAERKSHLDHPCPKEITHHLAERSDRFAAFQCCRRYWFLSTNG